MKRLIRESNPVERIHSLTSSEEIEGSIFTEDEEDGQFELLDRKSVTDSDGFSTDYSLYYDVLNDRYVTVFGDRDFYRPEDGYFDYECENESEAWDWFENYTGFDDED